jgi:uncharacterized protein DUF1259
MNTIIRLLILMSLAALPITASAQGPDASKIDQPLGKSGQRVGDVYRVGFPRTDLRVSVNGLAIKPGLALGSWAAFSGTDDNAMVMGDLVLLESELNPVIEKLRSAGFEISAVHNHLIDETPRVIYLHYMGHGPASELATSLRAALAISKTPFDAPPSAAPETAPPAWVKVVNDSVGRTGTFKSGVLSFGVPRAGAITMNGMSLVPAQGVAESINFQDATGGTVATTGDFVLTAEEVNPVISALEQNHIRVTALHSHMLTEEPRLFFMHFWAVGTPQDVGAGIKAALDKVNLK